MRLIIASASVALLAACAAPSAVAPSGGVALVNPGFESTVPGRRGDPEGWFSFQHAGDRSYRFALDTGDPRSGERSLRIDNIGPEPYGAIGPSVEGAPHVGKVARFSGWMRTRDTDGSGAVLTLMVLQNGLPVAQNFMADAPVK